MDLKRLKHLVALADERNFGHAAQRVHLSQPTLSRSVQAAESELGMQLFDRGGTDVKCTAAGSFVIERARKLPFDSRYLERDVSLYRERLIGDIAFGVGPFPAATLLPQLLIDMRKRYPGINSRVEVNNWSYLLEHLRAEELDFFLADIRDVPRDADLELTVVGQQHGSFYVRKGHPLLARKGLKPSAMVAFGLASVRLPPQIRKILGRLLGLGDHDALPIAVECDDIHLLKRIALESDTVLAASHAAVREEAAAELLQALELAGMPPLYAEAGIVTLKGRTPSPMAEYAMDFLTGLAKEQFV